MPQRRAMGAPNLVLRPQMQTLPASETEYAQCANAALTLALLARGQYEVTIDITHEYAWPCVDITDTREAATHNPISVTVEFNSSGKIEYRADDIPGGAYLVARNAPDALQWLIEVFETLHAQ